ncbi:MAG TPA: hypothetical protein VK978_01500, partial [Candidatus Saccharimonadales bacterium]|nr:hypothetical protein [Candidatus Saccharimonadales bacterium]
GVHFAQWRTPKTIAAYTKEEPPITIPSLEARRDAMVEFAAEYRTLFGPEHPWVRNGLTEVADIRAGIELLNKKPDSLESRLLRANYPIAIGTDTIGLPVYDLTYDYRKAHPKPKKEDPWPPGVAMSILSDVQDEFVIYGQIDRDRLAVMAVPPERKREVTALTRWVGISCKIIDLAALTEK